jgi:hypothetical protein
MLGALNAAHASKSALSHANPNSMVGKIAAYNQARAVLADDEAALANNTTNMALQAKVTLDEAKLTATENTLAQARHVATLTPAMITALNSLLGNK